MVCFRFSMTAIAPFDKTLINRNQPWLVLRKRRVGSGRVGAIHELPIQVSDPDTIPMGQYFARPTELMTDS